MSIWIVAMQGHWRKDVRIDLRYTRAGQGCCSIGASVERFIPVNSKNPAERTPSIRSIIDGTRRSCSALSRARLIDWPLLTTTVVTPASGRSTDITTCGLDGREVVPREPQSVEQSAGERESRAPHARARTGSIIEQKTMTDSNRLAAVVQIPALTVYGARYLTLAAFRGRVGRGPGIGPGLSFSRREGKTRSTAASVRPTSDTYL